MTRYKRLTVALLCSALVALAGCGKSSSSSNGGGGNNNAGLTGPPIKLMVIADVTGPGVDLSELPPGAKAAAQRINNSGGVNGSPLEIEVCDSKADPNQAAQCARQAVSDKVVAVVGSFVQQETGLPILEQNHIASIGQGASGPVSLTSPVSFPFTAVPNVAACMVSINADVLHAQHPNLAYTDVAAAQQSLPLLQGVAQIHGVNLNFTPVPPGKPDLSAEVAKATQGSDAVEVFTGNVDLPRFVNAARSSGFSGPLVVQGVNGPILKALGSNAEGLYLCDYSRPLDAGGPGADAFNADMDAFDKSVPRDITNINTWVSVFAFAAVAKTISGPITNQAVLDAMGKQHNLDLQGFFPPYSTDQPSQILGGKLPRLFNPNVYYDQIKNGKVVPVNDKFVNPWVPAQT